LRAGITDTCVICHSDPPSTSVPHSPQQNLLLASDGWTLDNSGTTAIPLSGLRSVHSSLESLGGCAKCHGTHLRQAAPTPEMPDKTGHLFEINLENCVPCHTPDDAGNILANLHSEITTRVSVLRSRIAAIDRNSLLLPRRNLLDAAEFNIDSIE